MRKLFFISLYLILFALTAFAVPAKRGIYRTATLADGTSLQLELRGNEFLRYWQSDDGQKYVKNPDTGFFELADMTAMRQNAAAKMANSRRTNALTRATTNSTIYTGEKKGLIILVNFSDLEFQSSHTPELYYQIANTENFSNSMGFRGSVKDYFKSQSYGQFVIDFDIAGPVTLPESYSYYGANSKNGTEYTSRLVEFVEGACNAADDEVDFSQYDWDGDGEVDQVFLLYAGIGEAYDEKAEDTIWPHEWSLYSASRKRLLLDGVYVNTYACGCELASQTQIDGIGTICHEFSHCLGLPDMYDTNYEYYGMDCWDLMDYGNYNGDSFVPAGYTSYERMFCGWATPVTLDNDCTIEGMTAIGDGGDTYIIYNDANENEYYLLENRQQTGWDAGLPNSGLLILHVDYDENAWNNNEVNTTSTQHCTIFPADDDFDNNRSGDIYPYQNKSLSPNLSGSSYSYVNNSLTNSSSPAATLNNPNTDGSYYMNKSITGITKYSNGTVSFTFSNPASQSGSVSAPTVSIPMSDGIYSLTGIYLGNNLSTLKKGIYIMNGKKFVK